MKLSASIDCLFSDKYSIEQKLDECLKAKITNIELWDYRKYDLQELKRLLDARKMKCIAICTTYFELTNINKQSKYLIALTEACIAANILGCKQIITQSGRKRTYADHNNIVATLQLASKILQKYDCTLLLEPLSKRLHPETYLRTTEECISILTEVNSMNIKMLFDIYHQYLTEGNIVDNMYANIDFIGHVHCAGTISREELYNSEVNYDVIFDALRQFYDKYVGLEYYRSTNKSLSEAYRMYHKHFE